MPTFQPTKEQIDRLNFQANQPLLITDADEVLLHFVAGLEQFLSEKGLWLNLTSYHLAGNIKKQGSNEDFPHADIADLVAEFFAQGVSDLQPVKGAADSLRHLSRRLQIVVLTNLPTEHQLDRQQHLALHGMPYPVIINEGSKGQAIRYLAEKVQAPIFFLDDAPQHLASAKECLAECICIHFVADKRLSQLTEIPPNIDHKAESWSDIMQVITDHLDKSTP